MLYQISRLNFNTGLLLVYARDVENLETLACRKIRQIFDIDGQYWLNVDTQKDLESKRGLINIMPLEGTKWGLYINGDTIDSKVLIEFCSKVYDTCLLIVHTENYGLIKRMQDAKGIKALGRYCATVWGNHLGGRDIQLLSDVYEVHLEKPLFDFLLKRYCRCPKEVVTLMQSMHSGYTVESERDIINLIGLGDISIANWLIDVMRTRPKSIKSRKITLGKRIMYLDNLASGLSDGYSSVQNFLLSTLDGFIDIKVNIISGNVNILDGNEAPERFSDKRKNRYDKLSRYTDILKSEFSLEFLLAVRAMFKRDNSDPRKAVLMWLFSIYSFVGTKDGEDEVRHQKIRYIAPVDYKFDLNNYNDYGQPVRKGVHYTPKPSKSGTIKPRVTVKAKKSNLVADISVAQLLGLQLTDDLNSLDDGGSENDS